MSALSVIQVTLLNFNAPPLLTNTTGGTSAGNPAAGTQQNSDPTAIVPATKGDKAAAGFLTALVLVATVGTIGFMVTGV
jgi:mannan endo-1,6-alpha-mannosidase